MANEENPAIEGTEATGRRTPASRPTRKASAKKITSKTITAKKVAPKKSTANKSAAKSVAETGGQARFPRHSVDRALRIPKAILEQNAGQPTTPLEAAQFLGLSSAGGPFGVEISSSKKYGFLSVAGSKLEVTPRARRALAPENESDRVNALREAILEAPDISDVYNFYRGENVPDKPFFVNALTNRFKIPADKVTDFEHVFDESILAAELLDQTGDRARLVDIGRETTGNAVSEAKLRTLRSKAVAGDSCFVMQPFAAPLGTYYDLVYRPAIEQCGLVAVRADTDIFGTGKIMDQVWRGIHSARVLVAELTSRNANVFYELGLAHALKKPVVLVSSNQEDVPFDLLHIRVILYDTSDPFWGKKLVDKVADNIRSAIENPEDAIFQVSD